MSLPIIDKNDVENIIYNCICIGEAMCGGQKKVFPCEINGEKCAVKFILLSENEDDIDDFKASMIDSVYERAIREISIMKRINSPYVVKLNDYPPQKIKHNNQIMLMYVEEWIDGDNLFDILKQGILSNEECIRLCENIVSAISKLWDINIVHRDIKPLNIMRRRDSGEYVLLDMGLAFDLEDKSLTQYGVIPGTKIYFSPEQLDYQNKREIDFRSDLFSLGIVMYESITGKHPFYKYGINDQELFRNIIHNSVEAPSSINPNVTDMLNEIISRLLSKQPSGRYRKCELLLKRLSQAKEEL